MRAFGNPIASGSIVGIQFRRGGGWRRLIRWTGPNIQLQSMIPSLTGVAQDIDYQIGQNGADGTLSATIGSVDDSAPPENELESVWEMDEGEANASIWEHPRIKAITARYSATEAATFRAEVEKMVQGTMQNATYADFITTLLLTNADFQGFVTRLARTNNQDTFYVPTTIIRHTLTGPLHWRYSFDYDSVARQMSTAKLLDTEKTITFDPPPNRTWLTRVPRLRDLKDGKLQVTREWHESESDTWKYEPIV